MKKSVVYCSFVILFLAYLNSFLLTADKKGTDISITKIEVNKDCYVVVTIKNLGDLPISNKSLRLRVKKQGGSSSRKPVNVKLAVGKTMTITSSTLITKSTNVTATIDPDNTLGETNTVNNTKTTLLNCRYETDIAISDIILDKYCRLKVQLINKGPKKYLQGQELRLIIWVDGKQQYNSIQKFSFYGETPGTKGTYIRIKQSANVKAVIDPRNILGESNTKNNELSKVVMCPLKMDLAVSDIYLLGRKCNVYVKLKNQGDWSISEKLRYRVWVNGKLEENKVKTFSISRGKEKNFRIDIKVTKPVKLKVVVDVDNILKEVDENNNRMTKDLTCQYYEEKKPDIAVTDLYLDKQCNLKVDLQNTGQTTFQNQMVRFKVWVDGNMVRDSNTSFTLMPYGLYILDPDVKLNKPKAEVEVFIDADNILPESNEQNNKKRSPLECDAAKRIDIMVSSIKPADDCRQLLVEFLNAGESSINQQLGIKIWVNGKLSKSYFYQFNLAPMKRTTSAVDLKLGERSEVRVMVDSNRILKEVNEKNNRMTKSLRCMPVKRADISATDVRLGNRNEMVVEFTNTGQVPIKQRLGVKIWVNDVQKRDYPMNFNLNPGQKYSTLTGIILTGLSKVHLFVDPDNQLDEKNEKNNEFHKELLVSEPGGSDISVSNIDADKNCELRVEFTNRGKSPVNKGLGVKIWVNGIQKRDYPMNFNLGPEKKWSTLTGITLDGMSRIKVVADPENLLGEKNIINNQMEKSVNCQKTPTIEPTSIEVFKPFNIRMNPKHPNEANPQFQWTFNKKTVSIIRGANHKVFLSGDSTGNKGWAVDDAIIINGSMYLGVSSSYTEKSGQLPNRIWKSSLDVTGLIPPNRQVDLTIELVDVGVSYGNTAIYLVVK